MKSGKHYAALNEAVELVECADYACRSVNSWPAIKALRPSSSRPRFFILSCSTLRAVSACQALGGDPLKPNSHGRKAMVDRFGRKSRRTAVKEVHGALRASLQQPAQPNGNRDRFVQPSVLGRGRPPFFWFIVLYGRFTGTIRINYASCKY